MPAYYDLPACFNNGAQQDVNDFAQLPFYLAMNEAKQFPRWNEWAQMFDDLPWQPNMGPIMRGTTPQPSVNGQSLFFPLAITTAAQKNVYNVTESTNDAILYRHKFESPQFNFIPSFQAFWKDYVKFASSDVARQIQIAQNNFIRTQVLSKSSVVLFAGQTSMEVAAPTALMDAAGTAAGSKTTAWLAAKVPLITQGLTLRVLYNAKQQWMETVNPPPLSAIRGMPDANQAVLGKYVLLTGKEAYDNFAFDSTISALKSIQLDLLFKDFHGQLFGDLTTKLQSSPLRMRLDGTFVAPQIYNEALKRPVPNPDYYQIGTSTSADIEWAFLLGDSPYKTIKVGPPPREFASTSMDQAKFYSLNWNGEVRITDQFLVDCPGGGGEKELNNYGEQIKLLSSAVFGIMEVDNRYVLPIAFRRRRVTLSEPE